MNDSIMLNRSRGSSSPSVIKASKIDVVTSSDQTNTSNYMFQDELIKSHRHHRLLNQRLTQGSSKIDQALVELEKTAPKPKIAKSVANTKNVNKIAEKPRKLGDLADILDQQFSHLPPKATSAVYHQNGNIYDNKDLFARSKAYKAKEKTQETKNQPITPFQSLSFLALGLFALGAATLGLTQFIKNATSDFAAENNSTAVVPNRILTFQGKLSDTDAISISDPQIMRFEFYNTSGGNTPPPIGGEKLWDSNLCEITPNSQGIFSVNLGAGTGNGADLSDCGGNLGNIFAENSSIWLQITVADEVLFPRQLIKSVPYALNSETLQGFAASQSATANTVPVVDADGNLKFNTEQTLIKNFGTLGLVSETGDLFLLPGSGNVYIGNQNLDANLFITGNASISSTLTLGENANHIIESNNDGLFFKTKVGQDLWENQFSLASNGYLGLGTNTPTQKLSLNQGSINFSFTQGPDLSNIRLTENSVDTNALKRVSSPSPLSVSVLSDSTGNLNSGVYKYAYTFVTAYGRETALSTYTAFNNTTDGKQFFINNLENYGLPNVVSRRVYRTKANGNEFYLVQTLNDQSSNFVDNMSDDELTVPLAVTSNQTGTFRYKVSFVTDQGETNPSANPAKITLNGDGRTIKIENIPLSPTTVNARKIYRSLADSDLYYLVATLTDNTTTTIIDNLSDQALAQQSAMAIGGGIFANNKLALSFNTDGSIVSETTLTAQGRLETNYGDNQGLQLPTSSGKPVAKIGQKLGDVVYDSSNQILYIFNGTEFIATGNSNTTASVSDSNCSGNICRLVLDPEYPGAVITGDGSNNTGDLTSGSDLIDNRYRFNYYRWLSTTDELNDIDTAINVTLPQNFDNWQESGLTVDFLTNSNLSTNNNLDLVVSRSGSELEVSKTNQVSTTANQWSSSALQTAPLLITGQELSVLGATGGDTLTLKLTSRSKSSNAVKVGQINLNYYNQNSNLGNDGQPIWKQLAGVLFPANSNQDVVFGGDSTSSAKIAFLNLGNVGTPTLYVKGNLFLDNQSKANYLDLAQNSSFSIRTLDENNDTNSRFTILSNGNIGIGVSSPSAKLDVGGDVNINGSLRFEPQSVTQVGVCNSNAKGKIYYDSTDLQFYACQATDSSGTNFAWTKLKQ